MLHTENSTQVDIILDNLQTNKSFANSRFAIELLVVGEGNPDIPMFINPKKSLDDEHTPGIFEVIHYDLFLLIELNEIRIYLCSYIILFLFQVVEVRTPPYKSMENYQTEGAYLQWKPISYGDASRDVSSTIETVQYPPLKVANHTSAIVNSMLYSYYGDKVNDLLTQRIIVSFGTKGDGFYKKTYYSTW